MSDSMAFPVTHAPIPPPTAKSAQAHTDSCDERLTGPSRQVLRRALEEAVYLNHAHVGVEHLLLGMLRENAELVAGVFRRRDMTLPMTRAAIDLIAGALGCHAAGDDAAASGEIGLSPSAQRVLDAAWLHAARLDSDQIAPEHIAGALCEQRHSMVIGIGAIETYASYISDLLD